MFFDFFPLIVGLLGGLHCLGMCGPLVLAYSINLQKSQTPSPDLSHGFQWRSNFSHHLAFHTGRLITYGTLGALAAGLFHAADLGRIFFNFRNGMTLFGGTLLLLIGLFLLKLLPLPSFLSTVSICQGSLCGRIMPPLFSSRTISSKIALGLCTGLLPCCLSWAMLVTSAATESAVKGFYTMVLFGIGTVPALFTVGVSASFISLRMRFMGEKMAALSVITMAIVLILRGAGLIS